MHNRYEQAVSREPASHGTLSACASAQGHAENGD